MKTFKQLTETISAKTLKDIKIASSIQNSSSFKETIRAEIDNMSVNELQYVLDNIKFSTRSLLFKAYIQAVLKTKSK